jgi:hypothetical protein
LATIFPMHVDKSGSCTWMVGNSAKCAP